MNNDEEVSTKETNSWPARCFASDCANDVLLEVGCAFCEHIISPRLFNYYQTPNDPLRCIQKLESQASQLKELQSFHQTYQKAWGALAPDELVLFSRAQKHLLAQDPVAFMARNQDAVFNRQVIEANLAQHRAEIEAMRQQLKAAEEGGVQVELAVVRRQLAEQKAQAALHAQRAQRMEAELEATRFELNANNLNWKRTGEEKDALEAQVVGLRVDVTRLEQALAQSLEEIAALRSDAEAVIRAEYAALLQQAEDEHRKRKMVDVDCVIANLNRQILDLRMKLQKEVALRREMKT